MLAPPTKAELIGYSGLVTDLDARYVIKNFLGKTQEQAIEMFKRGAITEDFTYMASAGLCYYLPAALGYLQSEESTGHQEFAHGLMCALSSQVSIFGMRGEPIALIKQITNYCDTHREKFGLSAEEDLFDEYLQKIRKI